MKYKNKRGFTLVELIVVLVILAILIALLIPALTGYIKKSRQKAALAECRQCVSAAQTLGSERYGKDGTIPVLDADKEEIQTLAEVSPGAGKGITVLEYDAYAKVVLLEYTSSRDIRVRYSNGTYSIITGSFGDADTIKEIKSVFDKYNTAMDSGALSVSTTCKAAEFVKDLKKETGLDLSELGAGTWGYRTGGPFLYWVPQTLSNEDIDKKIPVMRYNYSSGTYTVWIATVKEGHTETGGGKGYPTIGDTTSQYRPSTDQSKDKQTYSNMLEMYAKAVAEYK